MAEYLDPKTLTPEEFYRLQSETWGQGYDAGSGIVLKAVATAEFLATNRERERIIKLLEDTAIKNGKGTKAIHWHLDKLIALIKGENK